MGLYDAKSEKRSWAEQKHSIAGMPIPLSYTMLRADETAILDQM